MGEVPRRSAWEWLAPAGLAVAMLGTAFLLAPLPQNPDYHRFADSRTLLGVPHFWNVVTNLPFLVVGFVGVWWLLRDGGLARGRLFLDASEKAPFLVLFLGVGLTGLGSTYYHLMPTNETLLWDRLPMTVAFAALFAAILGERTRPQVGLTLLGPLLLLGVGSVLLWYFGERHGAGNLHPYLAVQLYPIVIIPLLLLFLPARYTRGSDYLILLGWYLLAKVLELADRSLYATLGGVGGHPLKHLAAGMGGFLILRMLLLRKPITGSEP